jgi:hypothetical protein
MTLAQIAAVEDATGIGLSDWPESPKKGLLYASIYSQLKGVSLEEAMKQRLRDIDLTEPEDPTTASG